MITFFLSLFLFPFLNKHLEPHQKPFILVCFRIHRSFTTSQFLLPNRMVCELCVFACVWMLGKCVFVSLFFWEKKRNIFLVLFLLLLLLRLCSLEFPFWYFSHYTKAEEQKLWFVWLKYAFELRQQCVFLFDHLIALERIFSHSRTFTISPSRFRFSLSLSLLLWAFNGRTFNINAHLPPLFSAL